MAGFEPTPSRMRAETLSYLDYFERLFHLNVLFSVAVEICNMRDCRWVHRSRNPLLD